MSNEKLIVTTSDGNDIPVIMAPPGHGAGVSFIIPTLLTWQKSRTVTDVMAEPCKRGYTKPKAWPSK
jgi:type IV secretory pathway TraG/TraD family ATPase VirD4